MVAVLNHHWLVIVSLAFFALLCDSKTTQTSGSLEDQQAAAEQFFTGNNAGGSHTNNWAVLVAASKYWFNYRVRTLGSLRMQFLTLL